jgi:hypothetical protein
MLLKGLFYQSSPYRWTGQASNKQTPPHQLSRFSEGCHSRGGFSKEEVWGLWGDVGEVKLLISPEKLPKKRLDENSFTR